MTGDPAVRLLAALRKAGSDVFVDDNTLFCSPPLRHVDWIGDVEEAIEEWYDDLKLLVQGEPHITIH